MEKSTDGHYVMKFGLTFAVTFESGAEHNDLSNLKLLVHAREKTTTQGSACEKAKKEKSMCKKNMNNETLRGKITNNETMCETNNNPETLCEQQSNHEIFCDKISKKEQLFGKNNNDKDILYDQIQNSEISAEDTKCVICLKTYKTIGSLRCHLRYEHLPVSKIFTCYYCGDVFTRPWSCRRHERKQHK